MRCVASFLRSSNIVSPWAAPNFLRASRKAANPVSVAAQSAGKNYLLKRHQGTEVLTAHDARQIAGVIEIENPQGQTVVPAHDDSGGIHHVQPVGEHFVEGEARVPRGFWVAHWI